MGEDKKTPSDNAFLSVCIIAEVSTYLYLSIRTRIEKMQALFVLYDVKLWGINLTNKTHRYSAANTWYNKSPRAHGTKKRTIFIESILAQASKILFFPRYVNSSENIFVVIF